MSTTNASLTIQGIDVEIVYKEIKNLHIGVYPPLGKVRVAAPTRLDHEQIRLAVIQRLPWITSVRLIGGGMVVRSDGGIEYAQRRAPTDQQQQGDSQQRCDRPRQVHHAQGRS